MPTNYSGGFLGKDNHDREGFTIKDSGERQQFESGMVRDTTEGKLDYLLVRDGPMYLRWVKHLTAGAKKYAKRNWMQARGQAEYDRFVESATRHFEAWLAGERDEDHAAGVFFNINGAEYVRDLAAATQHPSDDGRSAHPNDFEYVTDTSSLEIPRFDPRTEREILDAQLARAK